MTRLCDDGQMAGLIAAIRDDDRTDIDKIDHILAAFPEDPRLHFMRGSALAGKGRSIEAHRSLQRAVELAPDFALARYQLGFFELTSGEPEKALSTWGPLLRLPADQYLRRFVEGLTHLIRDEFEAAIAEFEAGMAINSDNPPLNHDIGLLIAECSKLLDKGPTPEDDSASATSFLLGQMVPGQTQH
jgi:tetratricopeptide (TPR) repeat protein